MIVHNVEDDLDAGIMKCLHHVPEFAEGIARHQVRRGSKEGDRVIAPEVAQAFSYQRRFIDRGMHRKKLHCGDAEVAEIFDY